MVGGSTVLYSIFLDAVNAWMYFGNTRVITNSLSLLHIFFKTRYVKYHAFFWLVPAYACPLAVAVFNVKPHVAKRPGKLT